MKFEQVLNESFPRYKLQYVGTRPNYKIHDKNPYVLCIDKKYNVDGHGESILGINLNYFKGDKPKLIKDINKTDNKAGFMGFNAKLNFRKFLKKETEKWEAEERKRRYVNLIGNYPFLGEFIRRYKLSGEDGTGVISQKRKLFK
jgi:hypothetical protein